MSGQVHGQVRPCRWICNRGNILNLPDNPLQYLSLSHTHTHTHTHTQRISQKFRFTMR